MKEVREAMQTIKGASTIKVLEGICGVGKTTQMIQQIKDNSEDRYLIVLPLLDEIDRYQEELPELNFKEPSNENGTKTEHFKDLLSDKSNILCTHALFELWDRETEELIKEVGYHIVIDEETNVIEPVAVKEQVITNLKKLGYISIDDETGLVRWDFAKSGYNYNGEKEHIRVIKKAQSGSLYCFDQKFFVYELPHRLFKIGKEYTVMTYLFKGNFMESYFNSHGITYEIEQIDLRQANILKQDARGLINIVSMTPNMKRILSKHKSLFKNAIPK